ncbi:hypothetical protein RRG08_034678 [Elysia crispata]|uniref:Uncharacterized protein n=1 Tax=Elysia crispata TaxID=231223 RepID=A0AAE0Z196_9GAST|nr:hypothetical protein RRG08_034678 [Elysia crispata]
MLDGHRSHKNREQRYRETIAGEKYMLMRPSQSQNDALYTPRNHKKRTITILGAKVKAERGCTAVRLLRRR